MHILFVMLQLLPSVIAVGMSKILSIIDMTRQLFAVFSVLRVYALTERNLAVAVVVAVLALVPFGTNLVRCLFEMSNNEVTMLIRKYNSIVVLSLS